jgi:hypothetical protein
VFYSVQQTNRLQRYLIVSQSNVGSGETTKFRLDQQSLLGGLLAMFVGLVAVLLPLVFVSMKAYESPVFPLVRTAIEGMTLFTYVGLLVGGVLIGWLFRNPIILGFVTMLPFYIFAVIEILVDPGSHKLWLIEFTIYLALSLLAVLGGAFGRWMKQLIRRNGE